MFIGLVLGLAIAAGVAYYLGKNGLTAPLPAVATGKDSARGGRADPVTTGSAAEKPRFDFYKILPGAEEPRVAGDHKSVDKVTARADKVVVPDVVAKAPEMRPIKSSDRFWLQAGAFGNEADAENLRARLALSGWEAAIQSASLPDKTLRYRVRIGPYDNTEELNRVKTELGNRGFDAAVIKNQ